MWTLPNLLSLFRILLVPFLAYLMSFTDPVSCALAALVFIIASVTDMLDGYLARRHKSVSDFGKILDPLADKLLVVTALIMLVAIDRPGDVYVPVWLVVIIVAREVAVTVLRGIALTEGIVIPADELGKYKLLVQTFALVGLMVHYPYMGIDFFVVGMYFLVLSTVLAVWSGVEYHVQFLRLLRARSVPADTSRIPPSFPRKRESRQGGGEAHGN